ncbi:MAG: Fur family transcriptional regulator [Saccharofermentanales bacterium]|nr:transcriptional repressor [Clostridiaceae bacterium]
MSVKNTRQTKQKSLILATIRKAGRLLTAEQILTAARKTLPKLALTTVYRNLEQLSNQQIITRLIHPDGVTRYRITDELHNHDVVCLNCSKTLEISQCPLDCLTLQIEESTGFKITAHQLTLYGYCAECSSGSPDSETKDNLGVEHM